MIRIRQIANANSAPGDLIFIGGSDAAFCRADLNAVCAVFANAIKFRMNGQDKRSRLGNLETIRIDFHALSFDPLDFI